MANSQPDAFEQVQIDIFLVVLDDRITVDLSGERGKTSEQQRSCAVLLGEHQYLVLEPNSVFVLLELDPTPALDTPDFSAQSFNSTFQTEIVAKHGTQRYVLP